MDIRLLLSTLLLFHPITSFAIPYFELNEVPQNEDFGPWPPSTHFQSFDSTDSNEIKVLRIQVDWSSVGEMYILKHTIVEKSGTPALLARAKRRPQLGSYLGILRSKSSGQPLFYDSVGTGKEFRKLTRAMSFRFPIPSEPSVFELWSENPDTGTMEKVLDKDVRKKDFKELASLSSSPEVRCMKPAISSPSLRMNIYSEGYLDSSKDKFFVQARQTVDTLIAQNFPGLDLLEICAVYVPSANKLGKASNLGWPVPETETFLGLFFPYWDNFGRWFHVIYPTREKRFRDGVGQVPYDYAMVLVDDDEYWGVGNFMELTAVPAGNKNFVYLLLHEFGHFFGLNEEYEGGGRTELEFAPQMPEPWSQNITFMSSKSWQDLKWHACVGSNVPLPTPDVMWTDNPPLYGAYQGGYGDSAPLGKSHKPGYACIMRTGKHFCEVCSKAILDLMRFDLGLSHLQVTEPLHEH